MEVRSASPHSLANLRHFGADYQNNKTNMANIVARYAAVIGSAPTVPSCGGAPLADAFLFFKCEAQTDSAAFASAVAVCVMDQINK